VDKSHPLIKKVYATKDQLKEQANDPVTFELDGKTVPQPSLATYAAKNPVLLEKDYWGRLIALGEYDYTRPGGCGKPVLYLYPTTPTKVNVSFAAPMELDVNIPTYHNGWSVLAQPNGQLTDLQPQFTNCSTIDASKAGSEYAKQACASKTYPYLYWSGNSLTGDYPSVQEGWVVAKADLASFMNKTLDSVGFTKQEKADMLEYWLPQMQAKNSPYYKISFLQTAEMNRIAPMNITPAPQSLYRLFLDFTPLQSNSGISLKPQTLNKVVRNGFTAVEWGGLKR
jgi:internalin A